MGYSFCDLKIANPIEFYDLRKTKDRKLKYEIWEFTNELSPVDLYSYLYVKYGPPNGIQNFLRSDDSNNLIHWECLLLGEFGYILIHGQNFRSEVHLCSDKIDNELTLENFIKQFKAEFGKFKNEISKFKKQLERWTQFVNPYQRIHSSFYQLLEKFEGLNLNPKKEKLSQPSRAEDLEKYVNNWKEISEKYSFAIGLAFGLRSILPVLGESFVNFLIFVLCRPEIKAKKRLFENVIRQHIDIRIQSLHLNCVGFKKAIDYSVEECKSFHRIMGNRNDLLHGNVDIKKLSFGEVYFNNRIPLFVNYDDFWDKSIGVSMDSIKICTVPRVIGPLCS